ncbi:MAG TPA: glycosyltransferase family 39 protein, partial [Puia sp.]
MHISEAEDENFKVKPLQLICIVAILQLVIAFFTTPMIFSFDESMWHYIGRNWFRNGLVPYSGGVDNKSPLIFVIFGISDWLFGVNYWFPRVVGIAVQSAGIFWLFKIATNTMDRRAGMFAIMFYGLSLLWRSTGGKYVSYTETYAITCIIISVYFSIVCSAKRHAFIGGVFSGLGLGFRLTAIFGILPMMIFTLKKDSKSALYYFGGIMASIAFLILLFSLAGIKVNDFLFYGLADNFGAGSVTARSFAWKSQQFANGFFYSEIILFYPAIIAYFILKRKIDFLEAWLVSEFCGIIILGTYDPSHFKNLLPVMSLISAFV